MKYKTFKLMITTIIFFALITGFSHVFAASDETLVVKKTDKEYIVYIKDNLDSAFEFAYSNDKNANKEELTYRNSAKDLAEGEANNIAYVDEELYNTYFSKDTYVWARTESGEYIAESFKVDLNSYLTDEDIELANTITKRIAADSSLSYNKPAEMQGDVKVTKTVGKVAILEEGTTEYILVKIPESGDYYDFMKITEKIANGKVGDFYSKLQVAKEFSGLYSKLVPNESSKEWVKVTNNEVLQPEEAHKDEQYVLWLKNTNSGETKIDAQFLTCFEDYKPEVISEKVVTKLPVTSDDPTLFIVLGILVAVAIVTIAARIFISKKEKN